MLIGTNNNHDAIDCNFFLVLNGGKRRDPTFTVPHLTPSSESVCQFCAPMNFHLLNTDPKCDIFLTVQV